MTQCRQFKYGFALLRLFLGTIVCRRFAAARVWNWPFMSYLENVNNEWNKVAVHQTTETYCLWSPHVLYLSPLCSCISLPRVRRHKTDHFIDTCHSLGRQLLDSHHGDPTFHLKVVPERFVMDMAVAKFFPGHSGFFCRFSFRQCSILISQQRLVW